MPLINLRTEHEIRTKYFVAKLVRSGTVVILSRWNTITQKQKIIILMPFNSFNLNHKFSGRRCLKILTITIGSLTKARLKVKKKNAYYTMQREYLDLNVEALKRDG